MYKIQLDPTLTASNGGFVLVLKTRYARVIGMKSALTKEERAERNGHIRMLYFGFAWSVRQLQFKYGFKSPKSIYAILYPEKINEYQRARLNKAKVSAV